MHATQHICQLVLQMKIPPLNFFGYVANPINGCHQFVFMCIHTKCYHAVVPRLLLCSLLYYIRCLPAAKQLDFICSLIYCNCISRIINVRVINEDNHNLCVCAPISCLSCNASVRPRQRQRERAQYNLALETSYMNCFWKIMSVYCERSNDSIIPFQRFSLAFNKRHPYSAAIPIPISVFIFISFCDVNWNFRVNKCHSNRTIRSPRTSKIQRIILVSDKMLLKGS